MEVTEPVADLEQIQEVWVEIPGSYTSEVRVVTIDSDRTAAEISNLSEDAKLRRQWLIIPLKD